MTAHIFQKGDNGPVSLKGGVRQAGKGYGAAGKGGGEPECGLGVVTFYSEGAGFIVLPSGFHTGSLLSRMVMPWRRVSGSYPRSFWTPEAWCFEGWSLHLPEAGRRRP